MEETEKKVQPEQPPVFKSRASAMKAYLEANPNPEGWEDWMTIYDLRTVEQKKELIRQLKEAQQQKDVKS